MTQRPFNQIEAVVYIDANTGAVVETVKMRCFYDWDNWDPYRKPEFRMVRRYAIDRENVVNPGFSDRNGSVVG